MSYEDKSPYFSKRVRIADVTSPKDLVGFKEFTVEVTYGNQEVRKIVKNMADLADIEERNIFDDIERLFKQRDDWAKKRGFHFVDSINGDVKK
jgi:hypothetical protein